MDTKSKERKQPQMDDAVQTQEEKRKDRKFDLINKEWAATAIFSGTILLLVTFLFVRHEIFIDMLSYLFDVLRPILIGLAIAFVLYHPTCQIKRFCQKLQLKMPHFPVNGASVLITYLLLLLILFMIIWIVVPQFITSISKFADNILVYYNNIMDFLNSSRGEQILKLLNENGFDPTTLRTRLMSFTSYIPDVISAIGTLANSLISGVIDFFIGLVFSVYVLAGRHKLCAQGKQILRHYLPEKHYRRFAHYGELTFKTFSNFISGQLMDAMILGILVFCVMSIGGLEYPMMIAVIIGITNMIPYVGPWLGTIPCALILLIINPWHAVAFVIIVIIAQQVDNNLIYPRVVGTSIGLPAIWVLFAITVGGGLFGIRGMIVGVPVMSVIYAVIREKSSPDAKRSKTPNDKKPQTHLHPVRYLRKKLKTSEKKK